MALLYRVVYLDTRDVAAVATTVRAAADAGYTHILLAFLVGGAAFDAAAAWAALDASTRQAAVAYANARGAKVMLCAGGSTDTDWYGTAAADYGETAAQWAVDYDLDGVDFDIENIDFGFGAGALTPAQTVQWLTDCNTAARAILGVNRVITHSPQAPYFAQIGVEGPNFFCGTTGGYTAVEGADFYNVQFYNQGADTFETYATIFEEYQGWSVAEINGYGVPLTKIVVGKPLLEADASNGYISPLDETVFVAQAIATLGWRTGIASWQWKASDSPALLQLLSVISCGPVYPSYLRTNGSRRRAF